MFRRILVALLLLAVGRFAASQLVNPDAAPAVATAGRLATQENGKIVIDRMTGLHWERGVAATGMNWSDAMSWCNVNTLGLPGSGWRLPTVGELNQLVDRQRSNPAIDPLFTGTPADDFWTSSAVAGESLPWSVSFYAGTTMTSDPATSHRVRCVR